MKSYDSVWILYLDMILKSGEDIFILNVQDKTCSFKVPTLFQDSWYMQALIINPGRQGVVSRCLPYFKIPDTCKPL